MDTPFLSDSRLCQLTTKITQHTWLAPQKKRRAPYSLPVCGAFLPHCVLMALVLKFSSQGLKFQLYSFSIKGKKYTCLRENSGFLWIRSPESIFYMLWEFFTRYYSPLTFFLIYPSSSSCLLKVHFLLWRGYKENWNQLISSSLTPSIWLATWAISILPYTPL